MFLLILSLISLILSGLSYIRMMSWLSLIGFCLGITIWVISRKIHQYDSEYRFAKPAFIISVLGTISNLIAVVVSFVLGGLFFGGFVTF